MGNTNAAVLPLPVIAQASRSRPSRAGGMACCWIGVGRVKPSSWRPRRRSGWRPKAEKGMNGSILLLGEPSAGGLDLAVALLRECGIREVEGFHRFDDRLRDREVHGPLAVGGDHVPRGMWGGGLRDHLLVGRHVVVPTVALVDVVGGELPVLRGVLQAGEEAPALLFLGH